MFGIFSAYIEYWQSATLSLRALLALLLWFCCLFVLCLAKWSYDGFRKALLKERQQHINGDNERKDRKIVCVDAVHWARTKITTHDDAQDHPRSAQLVRLWSMTSATSAATEALNAPYASEGQLSFRIDSFSLFGFDFGYPLHIAHDLWPIIIASTQCRFLCRPALCLYKKAGFAIRAEQRTFLLSTLKPRSFAS